jgi:hypothetical protein
LIAGLVYGNLVDFQMNIGGCVMKMFLKTSTGMLFGLALSTVPFATTAAQTAEAQRNCEDVLNSNVYRCEVKSSFGTQFTDCFRFTSPGFQSQHFDLFPDLLGEVLGCECKARGTFENPQFNESRFWHCASAGGAILGISFEGAAGQVKLFRTEAVNEFGDSFVFDCELDLACAVGSRVPSPSYSSE